MPPRKKKAVKKKGLPSPQHTIIKTELVPIESLQPYHRNPRVGDVTEIAKSLHINGQFKPVVVNVGTQTGRKNEILAGNHTWLGARKDVMWTEGDVEYDKPSWTHIWASFVDVDEEAAARIVIADNATTDKATYDEELRAAMLIDLPTVSGTGLSMDEVKGIIEEFGPTQEDLDGLAAGLDDLTREEGDDLEKDFQSVDLGDEGEVPEDKPMVSNRERLKIKEETGVDITKASEELKGILQMDDSPIFDDYVRVNGWQFPRLIPDMLVTPDDLPPHDKFKTWAGSATRDEDQTDVWWFYNYGVDSTSGMADVSKIFVAFFTFDEYFDRWWDAPSRYVAKLLNSKVQYIVTPDFSPVEAMGNTYCMWQMYRQLYMGRYFQEAGLKLMPHPIWPDGDMDFLLEYTIPALPKNVPVLAFQAQTIDPKNVTGGIDHYKDQLQHMISGIQPEVLLLYAGDPGYEIVKNLKLGDTEVRRLTTRQTLLSAKAKTRKKKEGL